MLNIFLTQFDLISFARLFELIGRQSSECLEVDGQPSQHWHDSCFFLTKAAYELLHHLNTIGLSWLLVCWSIGGNYIRSRSWWSIEHLWLSDFDHLIYHARQYVWYFIFENISVTPAGPMRRPPKSRRSSCYCYWFFSSPVSMSKSLLCLWFWATICYRIGLMMSPS